MARIVSFRVDGLAGRDGMYSKILERDVNVFYGINGTGKTTLLKILHSALSTDTSILEGLPFKSAEVEVYLNRHRSVFKRKFEQPEKQAQAEEAQKRHPSIAGAILGRRSVLKSQSMWKSEPEEPQGRSLTRYVDGYLPITRLYRAVGTQFSGVRAMSEEELDARFAQEVQRLWIDYSAIESNEISQAQEKGLANILHLVLTGEEPESEDDSVLETNEAYQRVSAFLGRQSGLAGVLDSQEEFERKYKETGQIKSIVKQIDLIERRIEKVTAPRQRLKELLESMYSRNKQIVFSEKEISVEISNKGKIGLPSLSSGEKQLFFISLAALQSGNSSLIIDEPELSMHVDWQKKLVVSLRDLNPTVQLILATHSPEITADLADEKVFKL
jgi:ABC-type cobalamin/Fe3+-siderophores transport system ATPase subunit